MSMGSPAARRFIGADADGYREVAPASFVAMGAGAAPGFSVPQRTAAQSLAPPPATPKEDLPVTREELMKMIEEAQGKRAPDSREDAQDRERDPSLLGKSQEYSPGMSPQERSDWWDTYDDVGMIERGLISADQAIQENPLLALAPIGMIGGGAAVPLAAASAVNAYQTGNTGMSLGGLIGGGLRNMMGGGGGRIDPNVMDGNNITPAQAASLAAVQRREARDANDNDNRGGVSRGAMSRARDLADRASRGDLPY